VCEEVNIWSVRKVSLLFHKTSFKVSMPFTKITQCGPRDKLNKLPYFFLTLSDTFLKSPANRYNRFPSTGRGTGPGGRSEGRRDLIHRNAIIKNIKSRGIIPTLDSSSAAIFYFVGKLRVVLRYNSHLFERRKYRCS